MTLSISTRQLVLLLVAVAVGVVALVTVLAVAFGGAGTAGLMGDQAKNIPWLI